MCDRYSLRKSRLTGVIQQNKRDSVTAGGRRFVHRPTLLLLCCVALLTSTAKVTQSLSSSFSRAKRSGSSDRRIRRRLAILWSMSQEETLGFLSRKRAHIQMDRKAWICLHAWDSAADFSTLKHQCFHHVSVLTWGAVLSISQQPHL